MSENSSVTVVITCFNYGNYLRGCVASALAQAGGPPAVIVVDDGSTDDATRLALDELPQAVRVVRQENAGVCRARNAGLALADTPFVIVLDADDELAPGALPALRTTLEQDPDVGFAYGYMELMGTHQGVLRFPDYDPYKLLYRHVIGLSALLRREVADDTGGFDPAFSAFEDWEFWINALAHGHRGRRIDAVTLHYRRHEASKFVSDRLAYRAAWRLLRKKHRELYADHALLAAQGGTGLPNRAVYRWLWGPRPWPAAVEAAAQRRVFGAR